MLCAVVVVIAVSAGLALMPHSGPGSVRPVLAVTEKTAAPGPEATPAPTPTRRVSVGTNVTQLGPGFSLKTLAGDTARLEDYRGKVVLLNFWVSWCPPCKEEMRLIQAAYEKHKDEGFVVLGIDMAFEDNTTEVERFVEDLGLTFPILMDEDGSVSRDYRVFSIPTSIYLDGDGIVRHFQIGATTGEQLNQYLEEMLLGLTTAVDDVHTTALTQLEEIGAPTKFVKAYSRNSVEEMSHGMSKIAYVGAGQSTLEGLTVKA